MKRILAILTLAAAAMTANANIILNWKADGGFYITGGPGGGDFWATGSSALAQLIFTTDNIITGAVDNAGANYLPTGNDSQLTTFTISSGSSTFGEFNAGVYNAAFQSGFVYVRVFQPGTIAAGTKYYDSPVFATINNGGPPASPDVLQVNTDTNNGNDLTNTVVAVPEPATFAFLGIGGVLLAVRRMRRA